MSEYDEIHKSEATPVKVGVDLSGLISACTAVESEPSRHPSGNISPDAVDPLIVPWKIYWNDATSSYNLYDPKVILPDGSMITATGTTGITEENTYYCRVEKDGDTYTAEVVTESTKTEDTVSVVKICEITESGEVKQFHIGYVTVSLGTTLVGDTDSSEVIHGDVQISGQLDPDDEDTSCGITVTTVSAIDASGDDTAQPPRVILNIKNRNEDETNWGAHTINYTDESGASKTAHVFSCSDIRIGSGGGSHDIANVVGSDYIDVTDKTEEEVTKRQVEAKILTGAASGEAADEHALLTHDTEQKVVAKKTFTGTGDVSSSDHVDVDGPNGKIEIVDADQERKIKLDAGDIPSTTCASKIISVHELKFKDKNNDTHSHHGLFCSDIDMTELGKTIRDVQVSQGSGSGTSTRIRWIYTDDSFTEVNIQNGLDGLPGSPGQDGDTPEITSITSGEYTYIYADGNLIATLRNGKNPVITASKEGKVTSIYADGQKIAEINDGEDAEVQDWDKITCISGIRFEQSGGKLKAILSKTEFWTPNTFNMHPVEYVDIETIDVSTVSEIDVVESESYSTSSHQLTNTRKTIKVLGTPQSAVDQTIFEATPLS